MEEKGASDLNLLALAYVREIGPVSIRRLLDRFGKADRIFSASLKALAQVEGISERKAKAIKDFSMWKQVEADREQMAKIGVKIVSEWDDNYPVSLKELPDRPVFLFARGDIIPEDRYAVAVVGTRNPTPYGEHFAGEISAELSRMGLTIVSGVARGVDTAAHTGALKAEGRTIGVLGSGPDVPYPRENAGLMERMSRSGAVITEFPPGTAPNRENFPRRNRIISGLSLGVLVVEAAADSGSLITAGLALEQGKEVFSVPGSVNSENSKGTNQLIKKGAKMVTGAGDILEELSPVLKGFIAEARKKAIPDLTGDEDRLLKTLGPEPRHVDEISRELGMDTPKLLGILLSLELKGVVAQSAGKKFFIC